MDIKEKQNKIKKTKNLIEYEPEVLKYLDESCVAKAIYKQEEEKEQPPKENPDVPYWKQRIKCDICGKEYFRSGTTKHRSTQHHKTYMMINDKMRKFILD